MSYRQLSLHSPFVCDTKAGPETVRLTGSQQEWQKQSKCANRSTSTLLGVAWMETYEFKMATVFIICVLFLLQLD